MSLLQHLLKNNIARSQAFTCAIHRNGALTSRFSIPKRDYGKSKALTDEPVKFTTSPAARNPNFVITHAHTKAKEDDMPWYYPHATNFSLAAFMIYFFILREENDVDLMISGEKTNYAEKIMEMQKAAMADAAKKKKEF